MKLNWNTPVRYLPMVGPAYEKRLEKLEIFTLSDLLLHIPTRYEDYSNRIRINELKEGMVATVIAQVISAKNVHTRSRKQIQQMSVNDKTGSLSITWFNQPYVIQNIKAGDTIAISGKVTRVGLFAEMMSPEFEMVRPHKSLLHVGRIVPIYAQTYGISSKWLRSRIAPLLSNNILETDFLPEDIRRSYNFVSIKSALETIHFPNSLEQVPKARERLAFDELFLLQLMAKSRRREWQTHQSVPGFHQQSEKITEFISKLPFTLTLAQQRVVTEILQDLHKDVPMNRLLQGDVGSGKTVVAAIAIYCSYLNGYESLLMAPTEILAQQHAVTLGELLTPFGLKTALFTSSVKPKDTQADVYIGTHALLEKTVQPQHVGLVVIDEQHRFGVRQRGILRSKGTAPHVLTMTATPIPRTTALVFHGDLDLSSIDEMPIGRIPIKTWVVPPQKRAAAYNWIQKQITKGQPHEQVFIVCPFIDVSESQQTVKAATEEFEQLKTKVFTDLRLGLLHGKMKSKEKDAVLSDFRAKKFDILVCTPVVEVGIDIPNATIMLIEAADRFGLAQLHQMRGRVGRGSKQSYCLLFAENASSQTVQRLKYMEKTASGKELAEIDLKIRGAGQVFGTLQHGRQLLKIASYEDTALVTAAQQNAQELLLNDPELNNYPLLKERVISSTIPEIAPD